MAMANASRKSSGSSKSLHELKEEIDSLTKSNRLKDDTIAFLQREKESLVREIKHYETICAGIEADIALQNRYEQELKTLRNDIQHLKEVGKRNRHARKSSLRDHSSGLDVQHKSVMDELCKSLNTLLSNSQTSSSQIIQKQLSEIMEHPDHERSSLNLLQVTNKALNEIQEQMAKYKQLLDTAQGQRTKMKYSHTISEGIPHSQAPRSALVRAVKHSMNGASASTSAQNRLHRMFNRSSTTVPPAMPEYRTVPGFLPGLGRLSRGGSGGVLGLASSRTNE